MRKLVATEVGSVPSASPEEISMLHLGWLIRACDDLNALFGPAQADRVIGGTQTVARRVADKLGNAIRLGQPVRKIEWSDRGAVVRSDTLAIAARHVIVAIPPNLAGAIEYEPSLPVNRVQVTQRWPQGLVIKVAMIYPRPFWRDDGLAGTSYDHVSIMGETADSSNPEGVSKAGVLTGFVYSDNARKVSTMAAGGERKMLLLGEIAKRFGPKALEPEHYHESNWSTDHLDARLLHRLPHPRCDLAVRLGGARSGRPDPLGRHRDRDALALLHRRRDPFRRARGGRDQARG